MEQLSTCYLRTRSWWCSKAMS